MVREEVMEIYTVSQARDNLFNLIDYVAESHDLVSISGKRNKAFLISEDDYNAMKETMYLMSVPGMRESILEGHAEPLKDSASSLNW